MSNNVAIKGTHEIYWYCYECSHIECIESAGTEKRYCPNCNNKLENTGWSETY